MHDHDGDSRRHTPGGAWAGSEPGGSAEEVREREEQWERDREGRGRRGHHRSHRKERVLHTRISEQLAEDIRGLAEDLRVPVSNLVRNVLEEAFTAVEEVTDDVGGILEEVMDQAEVAAERFRRYQDRRRERARGRGEAPREAADRPGSPGPGDAAVPDTGAPESLDLSEVVAWQPVVLNVEQRCVRTGRSLRPGEDAYLGLTPRGFSGHYLSREGLAALR